MAEKLLELFHCMWRKEAIPQEFKDEPIIYLYKRKGNAQVCDNHRASPLLLIAGKILAKILLSRLIEHLDQAALLPESVFRKDFYSKATPRKMLRTKCGPLHYLA